MTLAYLRSGLGLVAVSPLGGGGQGSQPSTLYLTTDMVHWRNVTPPRQVGPPEAYPLFEHASFLDARTGWVSAWSPATVAGAIYRTNNGGASWSSLSGGGHSGNAGATAFIQLVSPRIGFMESLEPTAPAMSLQVTTDAGASWRTVYNGPPATPPGGRLPGPFEMPMAFVNARRGFASEGLPPEGPFLSGEGDLFATSDGGSSWTRQSPPLPSGASACPTAAVTEASTSCLFANPTFSDPEHAVLPGAVVSGDRATVGFDVTVNGGLSWALRSQRTVTGDPPASIDGGFSYPAVSVASPSTWWLVGWNSGEITTSVTTDAGRHWAQVTAPQHPGVPGSLQAVDATRAWLMLYTPTPSGTTTQLLSTADAGRTWQAVAPTG